jgi:hypothetical protein
VSASRTGIAVTAVPPGVTEAPEVIEAPREYPAIPDTSHPPLFAPATSVDAQAPPVTETPFASRAPLGTETPPDTQAPPETQAPPGGWYPPTQDYRPASGPFAVPGNNGNNGGPSKTSWTGRVGTGPKLPGIERGRLVNVLVFGVAPVCLVGLVVVAFVLFAPAKRAPSAHAGFHAGAAISAPRQGTDAASPSSAATPSAQTAPAKAGKTAHGTGTGKRASMPSGVAPPARTGGGSHSTGTKKTSAPTKKQAPNPATPATPQNLGAPNFDGYCQHLGLGTAEVKADNAYGWRCTGNPGLVVNVQDACAWSYGLSVADVINVSTSYTSADSWQCWRIQGVLGQLDIASYCTAAGLGSAKLTVDDAYGWSCGGQPVDEQAACDFQYHSNDAIARFAVFADPYSWQCWDLLAETNDLPMCNLWHSAHLMFAAVPGFS